MLGPRSGVALFALLAIGIAAAQEKPAVAPPAPDTVAAMSQQIAQLTALVQKLQSRVEDLEGKMVAAPSPVASPSTMAGQSSSGPAASTSASNQAGLDPLRGTTVNVLLDGYYGFNFNNPIGRVNLLRAYDVSSNAFSLNQAAIVLESAPDPEHGKRYGLRLDLQYGQATATLQGSASNEPRPDVYRNLFQAYGTYVVPLGGGLTVDFGKWASSLGIEGNYTKDQMNYSRSLWFDFLPFYHMGARVSYKATNALMLNYWITNGTQQTEPFNGYKDELVGFVLQPRKNVGWTLNYYLGQEHPDFMYVPNSSQSNLPTQQGLPFEPIPNAANGKLHILDSYLTWNATPKLSFAIEGDYVIQRLRTTSAPSHSAGGAVYGRYELTPKLAFAARSEYLSDRGGLFTGNTQALKETTLTFEQKLAAGFLLRQEWRRDASNHPYFLTDTLGFLKKEQNTATLGLIWWFGAKEGAW